MDLLIDNPGFGLFGEYLAIPAEKERPMLERDALVHVAWLPEMEETAKAEGLTPPAAIKLAISEWMERRRVARGCPVVKGSSNLFHHPTPPHTTPWNVGHFSRRFDDRLTMGC